MLKIKDNVDLKVLENYGFKKDSYIFLSSGVDEINGDLEILKLYDLIKDNLIEKTD